MFRGDREEGQGGPALQGDRPVKPRVQLEEPSAGGCGRDGCGRSRRGSLECRAGSLGTAVSLEDHHPLSQ